jgi:hypothetical protein
VIEILEEPLADDEEGEDEPTGMSREIASHREGIVRTIEKCYKLWVCCEDYLYLIPLRPSKGKESEVRTNWELFKASALDEDWDELETVHFEDYDFADYLLGLKAYPTTVKKLKEDKGRMLKFVSKPPARKSTTLTKFNLLD